MAKKAIVVGSGAGGCMAARELAEQGFDVLVLEQGRSFKPMTISLKLFEPFRRAGMLVDERMIQAFFPEMRVIKAAGGLVHVDGRGIGGTTTLATGNALRWDGALAELGIDLDEEFAALDELVPQSTGHRAGWSHLTERLFSTFEELGLDPVVTPKLMEDPSHCTACGMCVLGCRHGAKWTADRLIAGNPAIGVAEGAEVLSVDIHGDHATGVSVRRGSKVEFVAADLVVLAAGGMNTPVILEASGIPTSPTFFDDPVLCVAARWEGAGLEHQLPMPFVSEQDKYILSPYFDWLSFFFNKGWRMPHGDIMSIMIKMADVSQGSYDGRRLTKRMADADWEVMARAVDQTYEIFEAPGVAREETFFGTLNAGHPGGCFPLGAAEAKTLHHASLPGNLYLADASLLPASMGNPPILTIMALAKRVARLAAESV